VPGRDTAGVWHNGAVPSTFPHARRGQLGYDQDEVDEFLEKARVAYTGDGSAGRVSATGIRRTAFSMRKGGYATDHVDSALERLEDAFANRERDRGREAGGDQAWYGEARATAQEVLDRLVRPLGHRFRRVGPFAVGYSPKEVDAFTERIIDFLRTGRALRVEDVRTVAFTPRRGGYSEAQVDYLLDTVITVLQAVR
jgi:DivIVA domain-containing protein